MNTQAIAEKYAGHPFIDPFDCLDASLSAARERSKWAVRAAKEGNHTVAAWHRRKRDEHMVQVRHFHALIDWSDE